jgi:hypothetical protein
MALKPTSIRLPEHVDTLLEQMAAKTNKPKYQIIVRVLEAYAEAAGALPAERSLPVRKTRVSGKEFQPIDVSLTPGLKEALAKYKRAVDDWSSPRSTSPGDKFYDDRPLSHHTRILVCKALAAEGYIPKQDWVTVPCPQPQREGEQL